MNFNNSKLTPEEQNKIKNTNLYRVLQDIENKYPPIQDINGIDNAEDYIAELDKKIAENEKLIEDCINAR